MQCVTLTQAVDQISAEYIKQSEETEPYSSTMWLTLVLSLCLIHDATAGRLGLFADPGATCQRNSNYSKLTYGCNAISQAVSTWEFARDRCRDDGGTLAIFLHENELIQIQVTIQTNNETMSKSPFSYVGINEDSDINVSAAPESVMYYTTSILDKPYSLRPDGDPSRNVYQCGVTPHPIRPRNSAIITNNASLIDPSNPSNYWPPVPNPFMFYCPKNVYDPQLQSYICRLPGTSHPTLGGYYDNCICGKWKEPGIRNFKGDYFTVQDQTEYILMETTTYQISALLWSDKDTPFPGFPKTDKYVPDKGIPIAGIKIKLNGKYYDIVVSNSPECQGNASFYANGKCAYQVGQTAKTIDTMSLATISTTGGWKALSVKMPVDGTRIMFDGAGNMEIMTTMPVGKANLKGLCGTCNDVPTKKGNPLPDGRKSKRKTLIASSWINTRGNNVTWGSQPPAIETCPSEIARHAAADRCRPLIDTTGYFGTCLSAGAVGVQTLGFGTYRQCMQKTCSHGPTAACQFFKTLGVACAIAKLTNYTESDLQCSTAPCPTNYTLSPTGMCYHPGDTEMYWDQAYRYCHKQNAHLVSFIDGDDIDFIKCNITKDLGSEVKTLWLGGVQDDQNQKHWTDGRPTSYNNWDGDSSDPEGKCASIDLDSGLWKFEKCDSAIHRPFCYVYGNINALCSNMPCPEPKICLDGACILAPAKVDACDPNPCQNKGQCISQGYFGSGYMCICASGFFGSKCERAKDAASSIFLSYPDTTLLNKFAVVPKKRAAPGGCWVEGKDAWYLLETENKASWEIAREKCRSYGGRLNSRESADDQVMFPEEGAYSAYIRYNDVPMIDGLDKKSDLFCESWGPTGCDANADSKCSLASPSGALDPQTCPVNNDDNKPYVCKRHADSCLCSKWFEPVFRTFNGEDIPLENNAAYILYSSANFSISIATRNICPYGRHCDGYTPSTSSPIFPYVPDRWPQVYRVSITFSSVVCHMSWKGYESYIGKPADWDDNDIIPLQDVACFGPADQTILNSLNWVGGGQDIVTMDLMNTPYGFSVVWDGYNVELRVKTSIAVAAKPGSGLCGSCDDQLRDSLFSTSHMQVDNKRVVASNWLIARDTWPSTSRRVPTCRTNDQFNAAVDLCYGLYPKRVFGEVGYPASKSPFLMLTDESKISQYYRQCLENVCQYGPVGVCSAITGLGGPKSDASGICDDDTASRCRFQYDGYSPAMNKKYCQYVDMSMAGGTPLTKAFTVARQNCQQRGYEIAQYNTADFDVDPNQKNWRNDLAEADYQIRFSVMGVDQEDDGAGVLSPGQVCLNMDTSTMKNDLQCAGDNNKALYFCYGQSGICGPTTTCFPPLSYCNETVPSNPTCSTRTPITFSSA